MSGSVEQLSYVLKSKMQNELGVFTHSELETDTRVDLPDVPYLHSVDLYAVVQSSRGNSLYEKFSAFLADKAQGCLVDYIKTFMSKFEQGVELTQALLFVGAMLLHYESNAPQTSLPVQGRKAGAKRSRPMPEADVLIPIPKRAEEGVKPSSVRTMVAHRKTLLAFKKIELALWERKATSPHRVYDEYNEYMAESVLWHQDVNPNKYLACWQGTSVPSLTSETVNKIKTMLSELEHDRMLGYLSCNVKRWNAVRAKVSATLSFLKTHDLSCSINYVSLLVDHLAYAIPSQPKDSELSAWHATICVQACVTQADLVYRDILKLDQVVADAVYTEACYKEASQGLINGFVYMPMRAALFVSTKSYLSFPERLSIFKIDERLMNMICNYLTSSGGFHYAAGTAEDTVVMRNKAVNRQALLNMYTAHNALHVSRANDTIHTKNNIITGDMTIKMYERNSFINFISTLCCSDLGGQAYGEETDEGHTPDEEAFYTVKLLNYLGLKGFPLALCFGPVALETFLFLSLLRGKGENYECPGNLWWFSATCVDFVMFCIKGEDGRYTVVAARATEAYVMCEEDVDAEDWRARIEVFLGWELRTVCLIKCKHPWVQALMLYVTNDVSVFPKPRQYLAKCKTILSGAVNLPCKGDAVVRRGCILLTESEKRPEPTERATDEEDITDLLPNRSLSIGGRELTSIPIFTGDEMSARVRPVDQKMEEEEAEDEAVQETQDQDSEESEEDVEEHEVEALGVRSEGEDVEEHEVEELGVRSEEGAPDADESEEDSGSSVVSVVEVQVLDPVLQAGGIPTQMTYTALNSSRDRLLAEASKSRTPGLTRPGLQRKSSSSESDGEKKGLRRTRRTGQKTRKARTREDGVDYSD